MIFQNLIKKDNKEEKAKSFKIKKWSGEIVNLTAKELFERVQNDSKSDYNWIAPATELIRVSNEEGFELKYSIGVQLIVLNCFANLELKKEYYGTRKKTDTNAVYFCYNSLPNDYKTVREIKEKYLRAFISSVVKYTEGEVRFHHHFGDSYSNFITKWEEEKFKQNFNKSSIDFEKLREELYEDFDIKLKTEEEKGTFEKDDEKEREDFSKFLDSIFKNTEFDLDVSKDFQETNTFLDSIFFT